MSSTPSNSNLIPDDVVFEEAILKYGSRKCFLIGLFLLCSSPGIINGFHMTTYVFYSSTPKHWCLIPELEKANWTTNHILNISCPTYKSFLIILCYHHTRRPDKESNCVYYKRNYTRLSKMSFEEAFREIKLQKEPQVIPCEHFSYQMETPGTSIVEEWDMVCSFLAAKATVQSALSTGKLLGALIFGTISDRFGRTVSFRSGCLIYLISGPLVAYGKYYQVLVIARIGLGIAASSVYESAFAIVSEICPTQLRSTLGVTYNQGYPLGMIIIAIIAYFVRNWKSLQMLISGIAFILIIHIFLIPESPRWLYYSERKERAWKILKKFRPSNNSNVQQSIEVSNTTPETLENRPGIWQRIFSSIVNNFQFFKYREFRNRLFICWYIWCTTATSYSSIIISANFLKVNPYHFNGITGVAEAISYFLITLVLKIVGRRNLTSFLLMTTSACHFSLIAIPSDFEYFIIVISFLVRVCVSGVFSVAIIHAFELFPTIARSRALSTSSMMAHFGSIFAPYLVDFFGNYSYWIPNTVLGSALITASLLTQMLPETQNLPLYNLLQDLESRSKSNPEERVSIKHCVPCAIFKKFKKRYFNRNT